MMRWGLTATVGLAVFLAIVGVAYVIYTIFRMILSFSEEPINFR